VSWKSALSKSLAPAQEFARPAITPMKLDLSKIVTVDFETYFDADYTLKKLSTSEYVRDPRFKIQMVGIKIGKRKTQIYDGKKGAAALKAIDWKTHTLLCHHTHFDGFIMSHHLGIVPHFYTDTLSMARGLHSNEVEGDLDSVAKFYGGSGKVEGFLEKTKGVLDWSPTLFKEGAVYCAQDIDECFRIFCEMLPKMPADEMELVDLIVRMFCDPVLMVDVPRVEAEHAREVERRERLFFTAINPLDYDIGGKHYDQAFHKKSLIKGPDERALEGPERLLHICKRLLGNNEFYADLLRAEGIEPPVKISPAWMKKPASERNDEDKWTYAFSKTDTRFINLPDDIDIWRSTLDPEKKRDVPKIVAKRERIANLVQARLAVKSTGNITRAARFIEAGRDGMRLPVGYAYYRAHTGRLGGANKMNMQNLTRGGELRLSILAPPGHELCVSDSAQIEARVNAWLWGQDDLLEAFRLARDIYSEFATAVFGRPITKADKNERHVGKVSVLGLGYQMGANKLQITLAQGALGGPPIILALSECHRIVNTYRNKNFRIRDGWSRCTRIIEDMAAGRTGAYKCLSWEKGVLWLPNGMSLKYPDLRKSVNEDTGYDEWTYQAGDMRSKIYGGLLCENIVQALARIIVMSQMLVINRKYRCVMSTHDEAVALAKAAAAEKCTAFMLKVMKTPLDWCPDIPLAAEGGHAPNYSK
jgi:DNA polymerase